MDRISKAYARDNDPELFNSITEIRNPGRAEWIDAYFEQRDDGLYMLKENRTIAEKLDSDTLMKDRRILLDSWLDNPTPQGLPRTTVKEGNLYYLYPKNGAVSEFDVGSGRADFGCGRGPFGRGSGLGVRRASKKRE